MRKKNQSFYFVYVCKIDFFVNLFTILPYLSSDGYGLIFFKKARLVKSLLSVVGRMAAKAKSATTAVKAALLSKSGQKVSSPSSSSQIEAAAKLNDSQWRKKYARYKDELSKGVWGYWELGLWKPLAISALHRAKLRREVLLAGE